MKTHRLIAVLLALLITSFGLHAQDDTDADTDGTTTDGTVITGTADGDFTDYAVTISGGETVVITLESVDFDALLRLFDGDGVELASDDDSGDGLNARLDFTAPDDDTYVVRVASFGAYSGDYTLAFSVPVEVAGAANTAPSIDDTAIDDTATDETADDAASADTEIASSDGWNVTLLEPGVPVTGAIDGVSGATLYAFNATEGDEVTIAMNYSGDSETDPYIVLIGSAGEVLAGDDESGGDGNALIEAYPIPWDGTYYVLAMDFELIVENPKAGDPLLPLAYEVIVTGATVPAAHADALELYSAPWQLSDEVAAVDLTSEQPIFLVEFTATAGQMLYIETYSETLDSLLMLFSPTGERIAIDDDSAGDLNSLIEAYTVTESGVYILAVTNAHFDETWYDDSEANGTVEFVINEG